MSTIAEPAIAQEANMPELQKTEETSRNGWPIENASDEGGGVWTRPIQGTAFAVAMRMGSVETVFTHLIRRYHYEIDSLRVGDVVGFKKPTADTLINESNHCSGTAIDIRPNWYPRGLSGGYNTQQRAIIQSILSDCDGIVEWGGNSEPVVDESHFELAVGPTDSRLDRVAEKLNLWNTSTGLGAGATGLR